MSSKNVFKASDVNVYWTGWIADMSPANVVNPDFYFKFKTKKDANKFVDMVNNGISTRVALHEISGE